MGDRGNVSRARALARGVMRAGRSGLERAGVNEEMGQMSRVRGPGERRMVQYKDKLPEG